MKMNKDDIEPAKGWGARKIGESTWLMDKKESEKEWKFALDVAQRIL